MILHRASYDPGLRARIIRRTALAYAAGPDPAADRPAHVRAASALAWVGNRLAIVQDDTNFIAFIDPSDHRTEALALPRGQGGARQFDDSRGNKAHKLDLESCIAIGQGDHTMLIAFGSGSTSARERILIADLLLDARPRVTLVPAPQVYAALRAATSFSGSELNVEGAVLAGARQVRLFGRGNGAPRDGRQPLNATCTLDWPMLWSHLVDRSAPVPVPGQIECFDLGAIEGIPLGFTDATAWPHGIVFSAAAEASPDTVRDGRVVGSAVGLIPEIGPIRCTRLLDEYGAPFCGKVEGLVSAREPGTLYAVADDDDPAKPSELCVIRIDGA